ncbi:Chromatin modification-related protein EAF3 [Candida viswanathii]|uniref:Chromatin modification-related protein EAF3 n=1 Tax=Candida viswanathii TaxID=5486 RepID=A0A367XMX8_9ASCO|nr:Chromatin modification-related protein EAF3 [Candida viswanathii]
MVDFKANQLVYAYHGPLIYEAKILKLKKKGDSFIINHDQQKETLEANEPRFDRAKWQNQDCYYLHYQGWNAKWDEWVGIDRIMEFNDENKFKKLELDQLTRKKKAPAASLATTSATATATTTATPSGTKRESKRLAANNANNSLTKKQKTANGKKSSAPPPQRRSLLLKIPDELKTLLVEDWQNVSKDRKLISLPSKYTIHQILQDYKSYRTKKLSSNQLSKLLEILNGLEMYFNKSLSLILLYKFENLQYLNFLKEDTINVENLQSKVYGVEHLSRLIVLLPNLISSTTMDGISTTVLMLELEELAGFLLNRLDIYRNTYDFTSPQYDRLART